MATRRVKKKGELRIRMYRVGFGDFFLFTVPSTEGPQHILIDCGVTPGKTKKGDIGTIKDAVADMARETDKKLALIIVTHRHQDHIIGFSRCADIFKDFEVGAVWMSTWEQQYDPNQKANQKSVASGFQDELTSLAFGMQEHLAMRADADSDASEAAAMLENATGVSSADLAASASRTEVKTGKGGGTNAASLAFLKTGLGIEPQYYEKGDTANLPKALADAGLSAIVLGPPPVDAFEFMKLMDLKKGVGQYLGQNSAGTEMKFSPFVESWNASACDYPKSAFGEWTRAAKDAPNAAMERAIRAAQPSLLLTAAKTLDNFLNNQSLVVLFTFAGKNLLFAGDAQGGNWEYWMFGGSPDKAPSIDQIEKGSDAILKKLDFYKMGHHGSTNATPVTAVEVMAGEFTTLCSTQEDSFGTVANQSEVPRMPLLEALQKKSVIVRSDYLPVNVTGNRVSAIKNAPAKLPKPRHGELEQGPIFVDYFPMR